MQKKLRYWVYIFLNTSLLWGQTSTWQPLSSSNQEWADASNWSAGSPYPGQVSSGESITPIFPLSIPFGNTSVTMSAPIDLLQGMEVNNGYQFSLLNASGLSFGSGSSLTLGSDIAMNLASNVNDPTTQYPVNINSPSTFTITIPGNSSLTLENIILNVSSNVSVAETGSITCEGVTFNTSEIFDIIGGISLTSTLISNTLVNTIVTNTGTFSANILAASGSSQFQNNSAGTLTVFEGVIWQDSAVCTNAGAIQIDGSLSLQLLGGQFTNNTGATFSTGDSSAAGGVEILGGTFINSGTTTINQNSFNDGGYSLILSSGSLQNLSSGAFTINGAAASSAPIVQVSGGTLTNSGTFSVPASYALQISGGSVNNSSTGTMTTGTSSSLGQIQVSGGTLGNTGTLTINNNSFSSANAALLVSSGTVTNGGTLLIPSSYALQISGGSVSNSSTGTMTTGNGSTLGQIQVSGGTLDNTGTLTVNNSSISSANAALLISLGAVTNENNFTVNGYAGLGAASPMQMSGGSFTNSSSGSLTLSGSSIGGQAAALTISGGSLTNFGSLNCITAANSLSMTGGTLQSSGSNAQTTLNGEVTLQNSTFDVQKGAQCSIGTWTMQGNTQAIITDSGTSVTVIGTCLVEGATLTIENQASMQLNGNMSIEDSGTVTAAASGALAGNNETLTIDTGTLQLQSGGSVNVNVISMNRSDSNLMISGPSTVTINSTGNFNNGQITFSNNAGAGTQVPLNIPAGTLNNHINAATSTYTPGAVYTLITTPTSGIIFWGNSTSPGALSLDGTSTPGISVAQQGNQYLFQYTAPKSSSSASYQEVRTTSRGNTLRDRAQEIAVRMRAPSRSAPSVTTHNELAYLGDLAQQRIVEQLEERSIKQPDLPWSVFAGPLGSIGSINATSTSSAATYHMLGGYTGFDFAWAGNRAPSCGAFGLGLFLEYTNTQTLNAFHLGSQRVQQAACDLFASFIPTCLPQLALNASIGGGWTWFAQKRLIDTYLTHTTARASTQGPFAEAIVGAEYTIDQQISVTFPRRLQLIPLATLQYAWWRLNGYREHGAGMLDMRIGHDQVQTFWGILGARANYLFGSEEGFGFRPELLLAWQYRGWRNGNDLSQTVLGNGLPAFVPPTWSSPSTLILEADARFVWHRAYFIQFFYELLFNNLYCNQQFRLEFNSAF